MRELGPDEDIIEVDHDFVEVDIKNDKQIDNKVNKEEIDDDFVDIDKELLEKSGISIGLGGELIVEEKYANGKFITDYVWMCIKQLGVSYADNRSKNKLPLFEVTDTRNNLISMLNGRMNDLYDKGRKNSIEFLECDFLKRAAANGWTPSDMEMLSSLFEGIYTYASDDEKKKGIELLRKIEKTVLHDMPARLGILTDIAGYANSFEAGEKMREELNPLINDSLSVGILPTEYASDENYAAFFKKNGFLNPNQMMGKGAPSENFLDLVNNATLYSTLSPTRKQEIRRKKDYVMAKMTDEEMNRFTRHSGHKHNNIKKSTRRAIKEVFGEEVYDDIDEMHRGTAEERRVTIHHSLGNKYMEKGEEVLEIDFAGSGFREARREYNGFHGKTFSDGTKSTDDSILRQFGERVNKPNSTKKYKHIRKKKTPVQTKDGKTMIKQRYSIAGPTPDLWLKPGAFNWGEYSIENTRVYGKNFVAQFLTPIFNKCISEGRVPDDIHINLTGHSRGAVSAGESVKLMRQWVEEFENTHLGAEGFGDKVKFNLILRDPVPGIFTKWFHGSIDLRNVPNLNTTLFCSMAQEHTNMAFPLQNVRGAKRIIIGTTEHGMELGSTDSSQVLEKGDGKAHLAGFYDSETGEYFRGSGLTEIPDGVYIADDNYNLIRVTSYSQLGKVIDSVYAGKSKQGRVDVIHNMVRNWFLDNELQMSFVDEDALEKATENNREVQDKILNSDNKRLKELQAIIRETKQLRDDDTISNELKIKQNEKIIKACRAYMKKTKIPATKKDSVYRMNLVSDLISFTMRENNHFKAETSKKLGKKNEIDEKMRKQKKRLEEKPGALDRKLENESNRFARDSKILEYINDTVSYCTKTVDALAETRKNAWFTSAEYINFLDKIKEGKTLGEHTTVNEFKKYLKELEHVSAEYEKWHDSGFGPLTEDGKTRRDISKEFKKYGQEISKCVISRSMYMPDKDKPIKEVLEERKEKIRTLLDKGAKFLDKEERNKNLIQDYGWTDISRPKDYSKKNKTEVRKILK